MTTSTLPDGFERETVILLVVHTATNPTLPGAAAPYFTPDDYFNFTVGNLATGEAGRLITALQHACRISSNICQLFLPVPYHCFSGMNDLTKQFFFATLSAAPEAAYLLHHLDAYCETFDLDPATVKDLLANAHIDTWDDGTTEVRLINTAGECARAVAYAKANDFGMIIPVSTGTQHAARALQTMFLAAKGTGIYVPGCAEAEVPGLEGQVSVIVDPPHLPDAPFAVANPAHQLHRLLPKLFGLRTRENWEAFTAELVALMQRYKLN